MSARHLAVGLALVLAAGACADSVAVGREEAIEVLVLDGVPRDRAVCIVAAVDGRIDLARVVGLDAGITDDELADLAAITASCRTVGSGNGTSVIDTDDPEAQLLLEGGGIAERVEQRVDDLVTGGLAPLVARCVGQAILGAVDPAAALADDTYVTEAIRVCDR